jgi:hypothetical protein
MDVEDMGGDARGRAGVDAVISLGGGVRWDVGARFFVRPDLRALVIPGRRPARTRGLFTLAVGWRF